MGQSDNKSYCGGLYCVKCSKDLKKSNYLLQCDTCCTKYLKHQPVSKSPAENYDVPKVCMNCSAKISRGEEVLCICCFLQTKVLKGPKFACHSCSKLSKVYWIDPTQGEDLAHCNFCFEMMSQEVVFQVCDGCSDRVCMVCLRKNPFLATGICSTCNGRRNLKLN